jgi:hypothetical protein
MSYVIGQSSVVGRRSSVIRPLSFVGRRSSVVGRRSSVVRHWSVVGRRSSVVGRPSYVLCFTSSVVRSPSFAFRRSSSVVRPPSSSVVCRSSFVAAHASSEAWVDSPGVARMMQQGIPMRHNLWYNQIESNEHRRRPHSTQPARKRVVVAHSNAGYANPVRRHTDPLGGLKLRYSPAQRSRHPRTQYQALPHR